MAKLEARAVCEDRFEIPLWELSRPTAVGRILVTGARLVKHKSLVLPLRVRDFSNSSQVVALFSREAGLVEGIAKGAHRPKNNPFRGPFDLAVLRELVWIDRRRGGLSILTDSDVVDGYRGLRRSWSRHVAASQVLEFLRAVRRGGRVDSGAFPISPAGTLGKLSLARSSEISEVLLEFEARALRVLGFLGAIDRCVHCSRAWPGSGRAAFYSAREGGLLCRECRTRARGGPVRSLLRATRVRASRMRRRARCRRGWSANGCGSCTEFFSTAPSSSWSGPMRMVRYSRVWL